MSDQGNISDQQRLAALEEQVKAILSALYKAGIMERPPEPNPELPTAIATDVEFIDGPVNVTVVFSFVCPCGKKHEHEVLTVPPRMPNPFEMAVRCPDRKGVARISFMRDKTKMQ